MPRPRKSSQRGSALLEFSILGIPMMFITISAISVSIDMWQFQSLSYATEQTARYISMHGLSCAQNGNTCTISVGNAATYFEGQAIALNSGSVNVSFTDSSGATACNPINTCESTATQFPATGHNSVGSDITVSATYTIRNPIAMFWAPNADAAKDYTVGAQSRQQILF
jgi:Flp pilus assembly protein TadG